MGKKNKLLPRMDYYNGVLINQNSDVTQGYAFHATPGFTRSLEEQLRDKRGITKAFLPLKPGLLLTFQYRYHECRYSPPQRESPPDPIQHANDRLFKDRPYLELHAYLFITQTAGSFDETPRLIPRLTGKNLAPATVRDDLALREFKEQAEQVVQILAHETGIVCRLLTPGELMGTRSTMGIAEPYGLFLLPGSKPAIEDIV